MPFFFSVACRSLCSASLRRVPALLEPPCGRAADGIIVGDVMKIVIPVGYAAAYVMTIIVTPLVGYRVFRAARQMSRAQKAWSLAGLAAGLACYTLVVSSLRDVF